MDLDLSKTFVPFDPLKGKGTYRNAGILQAFLLKNDALLLDGNQQKYRRMHQKCLATLQSRKRKITTKGNPGNYFCRLCISFYEICIHELMARPLCTMPCCVQVTRADFGLPEVPKSQRLSQIIVGSLHWANQSQDVTTVDGETTGATRNPSLDQDQGYASISDSNMLEEGGKKDYLDGVIFPGLWQLGLAFCSKLLLIQSRFEVFCAIRS